MEQVQKLNFFKRIRIALIDFEKYIHFLAEGFSKCVLFVLGVSILLSVIFAASNIAFIFIRYNSLENYIKERNL